MLKYVGKGIALALLAAPLVAGELRAVNARGGDGDKATPPVYFNFQGHIRQSGSIPPDGSYSASFTIYDAASGGSVVWGPYSTTINLVSGVFNVSLPVPLSVFLNNTNLWIEVNIPSLGGVYNPRVKINAAAYAYNAYMSDSTQRIRDEAVNLYDLAGFNESANAVHTDMNDWDMDDNGRIDADLLDVPASGTDPGYIWNYNVTGTYQTNASYWISDFGIVGDTTSTRYAYLRRYNSGVYGISDNTTGAGVFGYGTGTDGVYGATDAAGYAGVYGYGAYNASSIGVLGIGPTSLSYVWTAGGVGGSFGGDIGLYAWGYYYGVWAQDSIDALNGAAVEGHNLHADGIGGLFYHGNLSSVYVPGGGAGAVANGDTFGFWGVGQDANLSMGLLGLANASSISTYYISNAGVVGNGGADGVDGFTLGSNDAFGTGVWGHADNQGNWGGYFDAPGRPYSSSSGPVPALQGYASATGGYVIGILGLGGSNTVSWFSTDPVGVEGSAGGAGAGILGRVDNTTLGWAGYFVGDVYASGNYYKGQAAGGNFLATGVFAHVENPETPEADVLYAPLSDLPKVYIDGTVKLANGKARVEIPEELRDAIDRVVSVVVTPVGSWSAVYVSNQSKSGFDITYVDGDPNATFSYIIVAVPKGAEQLDTYLTEKAARPSGLEEARVAKRPEAQKVTLTTKSAKAKPQKVIKRSGSGKENPGEVR